MAERQGHAQIAMIVREWHDKVANGGSGKEAGEVRGQEIRKFIAPPQNSLLRRKFSFSDLDEQKPIHINELAIFGELLGSFEAL